MGMALEVEEIGAKQREREEPTEQASDYRLVEKNGWNGPRMS